eukprot:GEMP01041845.1.p1 GENE.GEMP01041845.1~~GEMP01041845.1.p1  ORF type:complete len:358 (+),score=57.30 GEMP01041845.1:63-1136(+)
MGATNGCCTARDRPTEGSLGSSFIRSYPSVDSVHCAGQFTGTGDIYNVAYCPIEYWPDITHEGRKSWMLRVQGLSSDLLYLVGPLPFLSAKDLASASVDDIEEKTDSPKGSAADNVITDDVLAEAVCRLGMSTVDSGEPEVATPPAAQGSSTLRGGVLKMLPVATCRKMQSSNGVLTVVRNFFNDDADAIGTVQIKLYTGEQEGRQFAIPFHCDDFCGIFTFAPPSVPDILPFQNSLRGSVKDNSGTAVATNVSFGLMYDGWMLEHNIEFEPKEEMLMSLIVWPLIFSSSEWVSSVLSPVVRTRRFSYLSARNIKRVGLPRRVDSSVAYSSAEGAEIKFRIIWEADELEFSFDGIWV